MHTYINMYIHTCIFQDVIHNLQDKVAHLEQKYDQLHEGGPPGLVGLSRGLGKGEGERSLSWRRRWVRSRVRSGVDGGGEEI